MAVDREYGTGRLKKGGKENRNKDSRSCGSGLCLHDSGKKKGFSQTKEASKIKTNYKNTIDRMSKYSPVGRCGSVLTGVLELSNRHRPHSLEMVSGRRVEGYHSRTDQCVIKGLTQIEINQEPHLFPRQTPDQVPVRTRT